MWYRRGTHGQAAKLGRRPAAVPSEPWMRFGWWLKGPAENLQTQCFLGKTHGIGWQRGRGRLQGHWV